MAAHPSPHFPIPWPSSCLQVSDLGNEGGGPQTASTASPEGAPPLRQAGRRVGPHDARQRRPPSVPLPRPAPLPRQLTTRYASPPRGWASRSTLATRTVSRPSSTGMVGSAARGAWLGCGDERAQEGQEACANARRERVSAPLRLSLFFPGARTGGQEGEDELRRPVGGGRGGWEGWERCGWSRAERGGGGANTFREVGAGPTAPLPFVTHTRPPPPPPPQPPSFYGQPRADPLASLSPSRAKRGSSAPPARPPASAGPPPLWPPRCGARPRARPG